MLCGIVSGFVFGCVGKFGIEWNSAADSRAVLNERQDSSLQGETDGTSVYGTNSAAYKWHSSVWHQQSTVQMAQQRMAPTMHSVVVSIFRQHCPTACSEGRKVIIVHAEGDAMFVHYSHLIFKYS
jgi:hypothetical protein